MKTKFYVAVLIATLSTTVFAQSKVVEDDIYFKPGDDVKKREISKKVKPAYKEGAREIVYKDKTDDIADFVDTTSVELKDSARIAANTEEEQGYYLNGFNGTKSDMEYAERIRRFQHPKYRVFIGDPAYNDIYFLNDWDWNVYIDGSYAYVTPTWTNSYWFDYQYRPFSSWSFGYGYPYYGSYCGYSYYPWSWNQWGMGGYYGSYYGSYYHGYHHGYYDGYYYGNNWGYPSYRPSVRPSNGSFNRYPSTTSRNGSFSRDGSVSTRGTGASRTSYTSVGGSRDVVNGSGTRTIRSSATSNYTGSRGNTINSQTPVSDRSGTRTSTRITGGSRESYSSTPSTNRSSYSATRDGESQSRGSSSGVSTTSRTSVNSSTSNSSTSSRGTSYSGSGRSYSVGSSPATRNSSVSGSNSGTRSTSPSSTSSYSTSRSSSTYSGSSYNSGSNNSSYSSGSSSSYSGGSSSSSSSSGGSRSSSGSSSSSSGGGSRSSSGSSGRR